jgi:ferredoxin--NADP+ reductase
LPGEYVVGWIKRGPSGVIGTNKKDAQQTVDAILADIASANGHVRAPATVTPEADAAEAMLCARQPELIRYDGWEEIDRHERAAGEATGRPRVKLTRIDEMLRIAASGDPFTES